MLNYKSYRVPLNAKAAFVSVFIFFFSVTLIAQDKIHMINGIVIEAKIQQVGENSIDYKKFNNLNGPLLNIKKTDVKMLVYENGEKVEFTQEKAKRQYINKYILSNPGDTYKNYDVIITTKNENISCMIQNTNNNSITYKIRRSGADPQSIIYMDQVLKYSIRQKWYDAYGNPLEVDKSREQARQLVIEGKTKQAIAQYAELLKKDSINAILLAEDAYVLALGGYYDMALYRLDRSFGTNQKSPDMNFFTAQVFALMGYPDLATEFWKESDRNKVPEWIKPKYLELLNKHKRKQYAKPELTSEELIAKFKIANILAAQQSYIQSIALFRELTYILPNEYLPYIGYSITLEKVGALNKSAESVEKAISILGSSLEDNERKKILEQQLKDLKLRATKMPPNALPGLYQPVIMDINMPQMMAYAGGMVSPSLTSINLKVGYFITNSSNGSVDFGYSNSGNFSSTNFGLSLYARTKAFVTGFGLLINSNEITTNTYYKFSVGASIMNKNKTSSFDAFLDFNRGFKKDAVNAFGLSIGTSLYFGKRK